MATKAIELKLAAEGRGCLGRSQDDEPVFILCGRDRFAPVAIEAWCSAIENTIARGEMSLATQSEINEARDVAELMREWQRGVNGARTPD